MELRDMEYFLAIAREENITAAAKSLHLSQPALTKQLKMLEDEFGKQLVIRKNRGITLTEDGMIFKRRADEILDLARRTQNEIRTSDAELSGDIYICAGESEGIHFLTQAAKRLRDHHKDVRFHISSGDTDDVVEELEKGLIDFGLLFSALNPSKYNSIQIPFQDTWGVLMRKDSELAEKSIIETKDLIGKPLIVPRNDDYLNTAAAFLNTDPSKINISATYSLIFNASIMVADGLGYALCLDKILNLSGDTELCFRPLVPEVKAAMYVVWKKHKVLSRCADAFLKELTGSDNTNIQM
ncbi:MAG: LysR family transcriptional regulator [Firmicutes bacterium]|nr:LysR family transcriptional regulator [Bacillota bacterium]